MSNTAKKKYPRNYAPDWESLPESEVQYSKSLNLYYFDGRHYDELSANHNGIIGAGARLKKTIRSSHE